MLFESFKHELQESRDESIYKYQILAQQLSQKQDLRNQLEILEEDFIKEKEKIIQLCATDSTLLHRETEALTERELNTARLGFITNQLQEFYWPILIRLEKNKAVYRMLKNDFVGDKIDLDVVLPNHLAIIDILERKIHLAQPDSALIDEIRLYIEHVYMYESLRKGGYEGFPEEYDGQGFRDVLHKAMLVRTNHLQLEYDSILENLPEMEAVPYSSLYKGFQSELNSRSKSSKEQKLNYKQVTFDIRLNKFGKSYVNTFDTTNLVMISFKSFLQKANFSSFQIGIYIKKEDSSPKRRETFLFDPNKKDNPINIRLEEGQIKKVVIENMNYRVQLKSLWEDGSKTFATIRIESWRQLSEEELLEKR